jgi:hypothetical protein
VFQSVAPVINPCVPAFFVSPEDSGGRFAYIFSGMVKVQDLALSIFLEKDPVILCPVRHTHIQNIWKLFWLSGMICGLNMADRTPMRKEFGTVQKQLGAPWQKISPPSKLPKFICQPNLFLNKLVFKWEEHCSK